MIEIWTPVWTKDGYKTEPEKRTCEKFEECAEDNEGCLIFPNSSHFLTRLGALEKLRTEFECMLRVQGRNIEEAEQLLAHRREEAAKLTRDYSKVVAAIELDNEKESE